MLNLNRNYTNNNSPGICPTCSRPVIVQRMSWESTPPCKLCDPERPNDLEIDPTFITVREQPSLFEQLLHR